MEADAAGPAHRRAWDLIPWVVNATASAADRALVEQHLAGCADCREEFAFHLRLRDGIAQDAPPPHAVEPAWARLQSRLDRVEGEHANDAAEPVRVPRRSRWIGALAAMVALQSIALATLAGLWLGRDAPYQTLSRAAEAPPAVVRLVPAPTLALGELRALLDRSGLRIVQSSGDGAILGLAPQPGHAVAVDTVVATLRSNPAVLLAEPIVEQSRAP